MCSNICENTVNVLTLEEKFQSTSYIRGSIKHVFLNPHLIIHLANIRYYCILNNDLHKLNNVVSELKDEYHFFSFVKTIQMQEANFYYNSYNKTTFVSSTPIFYYGATNHYPMILTIIICFISNKHSYRNLVHLL